MNEKKKPSEYTAEFRVSAEIFFHTLKTELTHHEGYATRAEAKSHIFE
jgi:hypothetical protein